MLTALVASDCHLFNVLSVIYVYIYIYVTRACWVNLVGSLRSLFTPYVHSALKGCGPCFSNTRFDECRVMSYLTDTPMQLKHMKSRHPGEPWMHTAIMNKWWTLPSIFNIPTPQGGTRIAKTKSLCSNLLKPKLELNSPVSCINPFISSPIDISSTTVTSWNDVTIIYSFIWAGKALMHVQ